MAGNVALIIMDEAQTETARMGAFVKAQSMLVALGVALVSAQATESLIKTVITYALPEEPLQTLEQLNSVVAKSRKDTLGRMLTKLRQRADIHEDFDALLEHYLAQRNILAHNLDAIPGSDRATAEGRAIIEQFAKDFVELGIKVTQVLGGLLLAWQKQAGLGVKFPAGLEDVITEDYVSAVDLIFTAKPSGD